MRFRQSENETYCSEDCRTRVGTYAFQKFSSQNIRLDFAKIFSKKFSAKKANYFGLKNFRQIQAKYFDLCIGLYEESRLLTLPKFLASVLQYVQKTLPNAKMGEWKSCLALHNLLAPSILSRELTLHRRAEPSKTLSTLKSVSPAVN